MVFLAFTMRLSPGRRALYGASLVVTVIGLVELFRGMHLLLIPHPVFAPGTLWLLSGFLLLNLLMLIEVADRLSLKNDLEVARQIQLAMLPRAAFHTSGLEAFGITRPGQHRRRRLLRHPAAARRPGAAGARRRRRQGQPGGAADGAAAGDDAHAGGRGPGRAGPGRAAEPPGDEAGAALAVRHPVRGRCWTPPPATFTYVNAGPEPAAACGGAMGATIPFARAAWPWACSSRQPTRTGTTQLARGRRAGDVQRRRGGGGGQGRAAVRRSRRARDRRRSRLVLGEGAGLGAVRRRAARTPTTGG